MAKKQNFYQVGICPNCSNRTGQSFLSAVNECNALMTDRGKASVYGEVHTLSLFRCNGCNAILLYKTHFCDFLPANEADTLDPNWIFELDDVDRDSDFQDRSALQYSTPAFQQEWLPSERSLSLNVPSKVKEAYQKAFRVKHDPNSFAVQIGRALELVCKDRGKPGQNLKQDLTELAKDENFPPIVAQIADELREVRNTGAHPKTVDVREEQLPAINDFFHLVVTYIYEYPARLQEYRTLLEPELPEITLDESIN